jgi:hypothetical protein
VAKSTAENQDVGREGERGWQGRTKDRTECPTGARQGARWGAGRGAQRGPDGVPDGPDKMLDGARRSARW